MNEWPSEDGGPVPQPPITMTQAEPGPCGCDPSGGLVLRRTITIPNSRGLHARAAAKLVALAERFSACVNVSRAGQTVPACSIMGLMMLGAGQGSEVLVEAEGWDAREALDAVAGLIEAGFHED
jgi:phosphocarrier protein